MVFPIVASRCLTPTLTLVSQVRVCGGFTGTTHWFLFSGHRLLLIYDYHAGLFKTYHFDQLGVSVTTQVRGTALYLGLTVWGLAECPSLNMALATASRECLAVMLVTVMVPLGEVVMVGRCLVEWVFVVENVISFYS